MTARAARGWAVVAALRGSPGRSVRICHTRGEALRRLLLRLPGRARLVGRTEPLYIRDWVVGGHRVAMLEETRGCDPEGEERVYPVGQPATVSSVGTGRHGLTVTLVIGPEDEAIVNVFDEGDDVPFPFVCLSPADELKGQYQ